MKQSLGMRKQKRLFEKYWPTMKWWLWASVDWTLTETFPLKKLSWRSSINRSLWPVA
ncbi:hypothetical protein E2C01_056241 [Portunus trituberculatus]|uniref:Uncharacterized protein n=1 Tax=Portunus trituberculatus TaxID=210409 RepID=A0A5B7GZ26_PORTR|nr:hypothetical protein [Portunus trituberculatus]